MTAHAERSADRAREISDNDLIESAYREASLIEADAANESAQEEADQMTSGELFGWFDDFPAILAAMPKDARDAYYRAHRQFVAEAIKGAQQ